MRYTRIHRLLKILTLIQSGRGWNAPRLAAECGTSERNLYRDLDELKGAGVPVEFDRETDSYRIRGDFFLPPVQLTPEEALAASLLCEEIGQSEQIAFLRPAWRALSKIEAHLPRAIREEIAALRGHVQIQTAQANPPDGYIDVYQRIQRAIAARRALECRYEPADPNRTDDEVFLFEPYALFFSVRAWYAVGHHGGRDDLRSLKLSRFTAIRGTDRAYEIPQDFSIDAYLGNAWRMIRGDEDHEVEIWFDAKFAQTASDTLWHPTQSFEEHEDGSVTFRCTVSGLDEIVWWVLGMGPHCVVKRPHALRERVRELAARTAGRYEDAQGDGD